MPKRSAKVSRGSKRRGNTLATVNKYARTAGTVVRAIGKAYKSYKKVTRKNKKSSKETIIRPPPSGVSHSYTTLKYKPMKMMKGFRAITGSSTYENLSTFGFTSLSGRQGANVTHNGFNGTSGGDMQTIVIPQLQKGYNQSIYSGTESLVIPQFQTYQTSFKIILDSLINTSVFTNQSYAACQIEIYDLVSKVTTGVYASPVSVWASGAGTSTPEGVYELAGIQAASSSMQGSNFPYAVPTTSKAFNMIWKIVRRTKIELGPGRCHEHVYVFKPGRIIDTEYFADFSQVKGITIASMAVVQGLPGDDNTAVNTIGNVNIAPAKIVGVLRTKYVTRSVSSSPRNYNNANSLSNSATVINFVQEGSGAVQNAAVAAA
nr:MAG: capsid protein [Cressdnaviricota sp.]